MENINNQTVLDGLKELKEEIKMNTYLADCNNYALEDELLVTITLNEYRKLIISDATKKYESDDKFRSIIEDCKRLKEENTALRKENHMLKSGGCKSNEKSYITITKDNLVFTKDTGDK